MNEFMYLDLKRPATIQDVLEAVIKLSTHDEAEVLELAGAGRLQELFPFRAGEGDVLPSDFASEHELVQASAMPLSTRQRLATIEASVSSSSSTSTVPARRYQEREA
jgi:hypothetical protein